MPFPRCTPRSMRLLPLLAGMAASGIVQAQASDPNPYYIGVRQDISRDSNVYLTPASVPESSDTIFTTSLIGGLDQPLGRGRLFGNLALRHSKYNSHSDLDNNGYSGTLGLDWATVERISGNFTYRANRSLNQLNSEVQNQSIQPEQNLETTQQFDATARIGVVTKLTSVLTYSYRSIKNSDPRYAYLQFDQNMLSGGLNYSTSSALNFGLALRHTSGTYPQANAADGSTAEDEFKRNDVDLTARWIASGASTLNARLSFGKVDHSVAAQRSFSGTTGAVSWNWMPTGKLQFVTSLSRDTGQESTFYERVLNNNLITGTGDNSQVTNALQIDAIYSLSAKIKVDASVRALRRDLVNTAPGANQPNVSGTDRTTVASLGATWDPTRSITVGCNVRRQQRSTDVPQLSQAYNANSFGCYGQLTLQ